MKINITDLNGLVWLQNTIVFVKDEINGGLPAAIIPNDRVDMYINGEKINHTIFVHVKDTIELRPKDEIVECRMDIEYSEDEMQAYLNYMPAHTKKQIIKDVHSPVNNLVIEVEEMIFDLKIPRKEELLKVVNIKIKSGVMLNIIDEVIEKNMPGRFLIASGKPPVEPEDEWVELLFDSTLKEIALNSGGQQRVDFKNSVKYISFTPGQVIARIHESKEGVNGITVTGKTIPARKPKELVISPNNYISIDGQNIYTRKAGRPEMLVLNGKIEFIIHSELIFEQIDVKTQNVRYFGDVIVNNDVNEAMTVIAKHNVSVGGNVRHAEISAGNRIVVSQGIIESKINSGLWEITTNNPDEEICEIANMIKGLIQDIGFGGNFTNSFREMQNTKYKDLPRKIFEIISKFRLSKYNIDEEIQEEFITKLRVFLGEYSKVKSINDIKEIVEYLERRFLLFKEERKVTGDITAAHVVRAELKAIGNVVIHGKGSFQSNITAKNISINGSVRGGKLSAENSITINGEVGSDIGTPTTLEVPGNGYIKISQVHPDVVIKIGSKSYKFLDEQNSINARLINREIALK